MKYNVITDENNYVVLIRHTGSPRDYVELNLEDYDFSDNRLTAYRLTNNGLVFDSYKYEQIINAQTQKENEAKIDALQQELDSTDYICAKNVEQLMGYANTAVNGGTVPSIIGITDEQALMFVKAMMTALSDS